jgi:hypothetical protein
MPGGNSNFFYGRPQGQLDIAELLAEGAVEQFTAGPSGQVILPGNLPPGTPATYQLLYWTGSTWIPATVDSVLRTWFNALTTGLPANPNTFYNNGGVLCST